MLVAAGLFLLTIPAQAGEPASTWLERFQEGWSACERGELEVAQAHWTSCLELAPTNGTTAYHLACVAARRQRIEEAFEWLDRAARWGYADADVARWDEDLAPLRGDARFEPCLARMHAAHAEPTSGLTFSDTCGLQTFFGLFSGSVSADGSRLVIDDDPALLWDLESGEILATLQSPMPFRTGVSAVSPDGSLIATSGGGSSVSLWDGWSGESVRELGGVSVFARALEFSADGRRLFASGAGVDDTAAIWDVGTGRLQFLATKPARELARCSPDGTRVLTVGSVEVSIWDTGSKRVIGSERMPGSTAFRGGFTSDSTLAFVWNHDGGSLRAFDARTGERIGQRAVEARGARIAIVGSSHLAAIVEEDGSVALWDPVANSSRALTGPRAARGFELSSSPDGQLLVERTKASLRVLSCESGVVLWSEDGLWFPESFTLKFSADSRSLLIAGPSSGFQLREARTGRVRRALPGLRARPSVQALSADGRFLCIGCGPETEHIVDLSQARRPVELRVAPDARVAFSPDSEELALVDPRGQVRILERSSGRILRAWESGIPATSAYSRWRSPNWSPAGDRLAVSSHDQPAVLFDSRTGERLASLAERAFDGQQLVWSRDGRWLAGTVSENSVAVFDGRTGARIGPVLEYAEGISCLCFDPQGERILAGCQDARAYVRDWRSGREAYRLSHENQDMDGTLEVGHAEYSLDGTRIVTSTCSFWEVALWSTRDGSRLWAYDYGGGNPAAIPARFDASGSRIYVSGPSAGRVITDAATGLGLADAKDVGPRGAHGCRPIPKSSLYLASDMGGISIFDAPSGRLRQQHIDSADGWLTASATRHFTGDTPVAAITRLEFGARSESLAAYASLLCDPKRVRAAVAGIALRSARLPALPRVSLPQGFEHDVSCAGDVFDLPLSCESTTSVRRFLVRSEGVERSCVLEEGQSTFPLRVPRPSQGDRVRLRIQAIDSNGLLSRPARLTIRFTAADPAAGAPDRR